MSTRKAVGKLGEKLAIQYLERCGYQLIEMNYRKGRGEIDIIAIREGLLVFAEVKTCSYSHRKSMVEDKVSWYQREKIRQTADHYLSEINWKGNIRFDVLIVYLSEPSSVRHFKGYFG
jgi:putative endonuclease